MNKVYEYVMKQEKWAEDMEKATGLTMFNDQATAYWAVRQFMEVNELTQRLYTEKEVLILMQAVYNDGGMKSDVEILGEYIDSMEK